MKSYIQTAVLILLASVSGCKVLPITYVTQTPPLINISSDKQPVKVVVTNSIQYPKGYVKPRGFDEFPEQRVLAILKERLSANKVKLADTDAASKITIDLKKFQAVQDGGSWKATVGLTAISENPEGGTDRQNVEITINRFNASSNDAIRAVSTALSEALDSINWKNFLAN